MLALRRDHEWWRRSVVLVTLVAGAILLRLAFAQPAGSTAFYVLTLVLAATGALGGILSGPIPFTADRRDLAPAALGSIAIGLLTAGIFIAGAAVVGLIHPLRRYVVDVVTHTHGTSFALILVVTIANAFAEEIFFRGAVFAAVGPRYPIVITTVVYVATIAVSGKIALAFAAAVLGALLALERRITGGILVPALTHATWSACLLTILPLILPN